MAQPSQPDFQKKSSPSPIAPPSQAMAPRPFAPQVDLATPDIQTPDVAAPEAPALDSAPAFPKLNFKIRAAGGSPPPLQPKLTIGAPNDPYEQEADRVAAQAVQRIHSPAANLPTQNRTHQTQSVQRQAGPEQPVLKMKSMIQRETLPDEDEELQMKAMPQRLEMPSKNILQMQSSSSEEIASPDLEAKIHRARGGGQALTPHLQLQMGQAIGADFSGVRVHTDTQSDQLNRSIQAKAFTTGQDIFFRQGAYQPGNRGGQELIAHELTHVVQQNGGVQLGPNYPIHRQVIAIKQTSPDAVVQPARGKFGRILSDLAFLPLLGVGAIGAEVAARMTFGWEKDRKKIQTPTNQLDQQGNKSYVAQDIAIAGGGFASKYVLRGRRYDPKPAFAANPSMGKAVILFSGSGGPNEDMMEPVAEFYCRQGAVAFGVNYRGYGNSRDVGVLGGESTPLMSEQGLYDDARRIFNHVNQTVGFAAADITLHGFSLGGAVASHLAKKLAKPGPNGQPGVQLGGLVLHSSIKSAYKAARDQVGIPVAAQLGGLGAKGSAGNFDTESHLEQLAARDPNLPIHFMGGNYNAGDQLALSHTQLEQTGQGTFTNVSSRSGQGGHLDDNTTMPQLVDAQGNPRTDQHGNPMYPQAVPSGHLTPNMKDNLATLVAQGRARNPNALTHVRAR